MATLSGNLLMWVEWASRQQETPRVRPVLDSLKARHSDNYGWALACCGWKRELAEDVLQEAYLRVLDARAGNGVAVQSRSHETTDRDQE